MAIGGSRFSLEKTWGATRLANTTFNAPGNISIPFGKQEVKITGTGAAGSLVAGTYSPPAYPYAPYNTPSYPVASYSSTPGNLAYYTPTYQYTVQYYVTQSGGTSNYVFQPGGGTLYEAYGCPSPTYWSGYFAAYGLLQEYGYFFNCAPWTPAAVYNPSSYQAASYNTIPGNASTYNVIPGGNAKTYNSASYPVASYSIAPGNVAYYQQSYVYGYTFYVSTVQGYTGYDSLRYETGTGCPSPYSYSFFNPYYGIFYVQGDYYSCASSGSTAVYNSPSYSVATYNTLPSNISSYNSTTYAVILYNTVPGGVATYNTPITGTPSTIFGVTLPGGYGGPATPTIVKVPYYSIPDNSTHSVTVASGGYVTIQSE